MNSLSHSPSLFLFIEFVHFVDQLFNFFFQNFNERQFRNKFIFFHDIIQFCLGRTELLFEHFPIRIFHLNFIDQTFLVVDKLLNKCKVSVWNFLHFFTGQYFKFVGFFDKFFLEFIKFLVKLLSLMEHGLSKHVDLYKLFNDRLFFNWLS